MTTLADKAILLGADNRPPMLEKDTCDSWKSRMELYMMSRQYGRMILESVEKHPLLWSLIEENGVTRQKKYFELFAMEAIHAYCDVKVTNIILQGLPPEKFTISADDKIIPEPDVALELEKYISLTEAAEEEVARQVHANHARIVTEYVLEPARRKPSGIAFRDTSSVKKKMSLDPSQKLKGVQTLTPKEQLAADTMQALKESKKISRRQQVLQNQVKELIGYQGFPMSQQSLLKPQGSEEESEYTKEDDNENIKWVDTDEEDEKNDDDDDKSIDLEKTNDEETDDEFVENAKKAEEVKDDVKKAELPLTSSSLSVSSGFVSDFATPLIQSTVKKALEKTPLLMDKIRSYPTHDKHQDLFDALFNSLRLDDAIARGEADAEKVLRKRDHDDEGPIARPNQGKKTKRSRTKKYEPSKKSSTSKESSKGKSLDKTSKSSKFVAVEEPNEETIFEMASDGIEQTIDDMANDADQLPDESNQTKNKDLTTRI
nr:hypothetical protein [Tanacetum cinerariifolium]